MRSTGAFKGRGAADAATSPANVNHRAPSLVDLDVGGRILDLVRALAEGYRLAEVAEG
jgi:hypothetical protein